MNEEINPVLESAITGSEYHLKEALDMGYDINATTNNGINALILSMATGMENSKYREVLYKNNIDVNHKTDFDQTYLMLASFRGDFKLVEEALEHGAEVNLVDKNGHNSLMYACYDLPTSFKLKFQGLYNISYSYDSDSKILNSYYLNMLIEKIYKETKEKGKFLERKEIIKLLLESGIDKNAISRFRGNIFFGSDHGSLKYENMSALDEYMANTDVSDLEIIDILYNNSVRSNHTPFEYYLKPEMSIYILLEMSSCMVAKKKAKYLQKN